MITYKQFIINESYVPEPNTQYGSNEGGIHLNTETNKREYVKFPKTTEQANVEAATSDLYKQMGISTVNAKVKNIKGKTAVTSDWNPNLRSFRSANDILEAAKDPKIAKQLAKIHHAAVLTGNYDVIGLAYDNIFHDKQTGNIVSMDQGGAMHFRAQGKPKPFNKSIDEVNSFQNPIYTTGRVFGHLDPKHLSDASRDLQGLTDEHIDSVLRPHKLDHLGDTIKARRDMLIAHYRGTK